MVDRTSPTRKWWSPNTITAQTQKSPALSAMDHRRIRGQAHEKHQVERSTPQESLSDTPHARSLEPPSDSSQLRGHDDNKGFLLDLKHISISTQNRIDTYAEYNPTINSVLARRRTSILDLAGVSWCAIPVQLTPPSAHIARLHPPQ
jgi:hypothetical protein